jgi:hypothetical protein
MIYIIESLLLVEVEKQIIENDLEDQVDIQMHKVIVLVLHITFYHLLQHNYMFFHLDHGKVLVLKHHILIVSMLVIPLMLELEDCLGFFLVIPIWEVEVVVHHSY